MGTKRRRLPKYSCSIADMAINAISISLWVFSDRTGAMRPVMRHAFISKGTTSTNVINGNSIGLVPIWLLKKMKSMPGVKARANRI